MKKIFILIMAMAMAMAMATLTFAEVESDKLYDYAPEDCTALDQKNKIFPITTRAAILKSHLTPITLNDPVGDAKRNIANQDYRLLFFGASGYSIDRPIKKKNLCEMLTNFIEGGGHSIESEEWANLADKFQTYVSEHNKYMLNHGLKKHLTRLQ